MIVVCEDNENMVVVVALTPSIHYSVAKCEDLDTSEYAHVISSMPLAVDDSLDLSAALAEAEVPLAGTAKVLVLPPATILAAALLVARDRFTAAKALTSLGAHAIPFTSLCEAEAAALLRLELSTLGAVSDLTTLEGAPREWTWLRWRISAASLSVVSRGHALAVQRLRPEPRMAFVSNFLTAEECTHIIHLGVTGEGGQQLHPSRVVNHDLSGDTGRRSDARTSESCRVSAAQDRVVMRAVQRAAYLSGLTPAHSEAVQVVHYNSGQQYRPHYDFFQPCDARYAEKTKVQGNRLVSFFVYLSDCDGGGRTYFPTLRVGFTPKVGPAVMWYNMDRHGNPDERTLHAGEPVDRGEKWGMNIWLRERARANSAMKRRGPVRAKLAFSNGEAPALALTPNGTTAAVDVGDGPTINPAPAKVQLHLKVAPPPSMMTALRPCDHCSDSCGPVGLCLCRDRYEM